jgi:hypothetical protein
VGAHQTLAKKYPIPMKSPNQITKRQFADALQQLSGRLTSKHWELLREHYKAPNRSITARELAQKVGFKNYGGVNLQYGRLGVLLGEVLGYDNFDSSMLATITKPKDKDNSEWVWTMLPALAEALVSLQTVGATTHKAEIDQNPPPSKQGRDMSKEELDLLAGKLRWVIPDVFIMPPHEYVVEKDLERQEQREAFSALCDSCTHHPLRWKAFFRAYKAKNSYMEIGQYRYWYSQIGAARMMNRSFRGSEAGNIRGDEGDRAVKNWSGCTYAWQREYGVECENLRRYCNLIMVEASPSGDDFTIIRYAAMVARNAVSNWHSRCEEHTTDEKIEQNIRELMEGVEAVTGIKPANSKHVSCTDEEMRLKAVWMSHKNMDVFRVATDLRWFSTAPRLEIERVFRLQADRRYLIQLNVPPI